MYLNLNYFALFILKVRVCVPSWTEHFVAEKNMILE